MSTENIIVLGSSVLTQFSINTNHGGGNGGRVMIQNGSSAFEDDDIIVFTVQNVTNDQVTGSSQVTSFVIYDSAEDYVNGITKYTYGKQNPNDHGSIQSDLSGLGDTYLRINIHGLQPQDGGPHIGSFFVAPGVDLTDLRPVVQIDHEVDTDVDGDGVVDNTGDGNFNLDNNVIAEEVIEDETAVCLTRGTLIDTPSGPRYIESLLEGDLINTLDAGAQPIRWIGSRRVSATGKLAPVLIKAGALGNIRDMKVSPNHRMMLRGPKAEILFGERDVLVAAKHLVDDAKIRIVEGGTVEYFHMLFDEHQIIFAESCPTESLFPGEQALDSVSPEAREEILTLFPEAHSGSSDAQLSRYELKAWEAATLLSA